MQRAISLIAALVAVSALAATAPPSAGVWNIATSGKAASSGDLAFRITATDGSDPVDITVPVISGASEDSVARSIRRALSSQLPRERYSVQLGEGANVLVSDSRGRPDFSLELVDSDVENMRVAVQSVTPAASPTVPEQSVPADVPETRPPADRLPGNAVPPPSSEAPAPMGPDVPPPNGSVPGPINPPNGTIQVPSPDMRVPPPISVPAPGTSAPGPATPPPGDNSVPAPPPAPRPPQAPPPANSSPPPTLR